VTEPSEITVAAAGLADAYGGQTGEWKAVLLAGRTLGFAPEIVMKLCRGLDVPSPQALANTLVIAHDGAMEARAQRRPGWAFRVRSWPDKD